MDVLSCLSEEDLFPATMGESLPDEARSHLEQCSSCQDRLQRLRSTVDSFRDAIRQDPVRHEAVSYKAVEQQGPATESSCSPPTPPTDSARLPTAIGKYLVVGVLGKGGQATVYRVIHPELGKDLALKLCTKKVTPDRLDRELLVREARLMAHIDHPNLVRIYDLDFHHGQPFFAMEYYRGRSLETFRTGPAVSWAKAARWVAQLARALAAAHAQGIIHQDVKPANVIIDENDQPRLVDFGMARLRTAFSEDEWQPSGGTAAYMSPEQAAADAARLGPASDVFSLGGVLYYLLTRRDPFKAATWNEARLLASNCAFNDQALRSLNVPEWLKKACLKAMSPKPDDRPSALDFAQSIEQGLARPRWPLLLAAAATILLALFALWHFIPPSGTVDPARPPVVTAYDRPAIFLDAAIRKKQAFAKLHNALPLQTGDQLRFAVRAPADFQIALFWFDSQGQLKELLPFDKTKEGLVIFPSLKRFTELDEQTGTELIIAGGSKKGPLREKDLLPFLTQPMDELPDNLLVYMDGEGVDLVIGEFVLGGGGLTKRGGSEPVAVPLTGVEQRLEDMRKRLANRYPFLAALAFPHVK